jgi:Domain of unknown function (DUF4149)
MSLTKYRGYLDALRLILLSLWLGAAVFFSAVVAPSVFGVLRSFSVTNTGEIAGGIVTRTLAVVNVSGFIIGLFLLLTSFAVRGSRRRAAKTIELVCISLVIIATGVGHWLVAARMRALRAAMVLPIDQVPIDDARRMAFNSLHVYSVNALALAMIAALVIIFLIARTGRS